MTEFSISLPDQAWTIISTIVGGLLSAAAGFFAQRYSSKRARDEMIVRRLEETYEACQAVYDGHAARVKWLEARDNVALSEWESCPPSPGESMSRIKMRLKVYAPTAESSLERMDKAHQWFKKKWDELDQSIAAGRPLRKQVDFNDQDLRQNRDLLGEGATEAKQEVIKELRKFFH